MDNNYLQNNKNKYKIKFFQFKVKIQYINNN